MPGNLSSEKFNLFMFTGLISIKEETKFLGLLTHSSHPPLYCPWKTEFIKEKSKSKSEAR